LIFSSADDGRRRAVVVAAVVVVTDLRKETDFRNLLGGRTGDMPPYIGLSPMLPFVDLASGSRSNENWVFCSPPSAPNPLQLEQTVP
jgi:hypothetical protein